MKTESDVGTPDMRVSVVVYQPHLEMLETTLQTLIASAEAARRCGLLGKLSVDVIDNGTADEKALDGCVAAIPGLMSGSNLRTLRGHGNVGYGSGHNLSILVGTEDTHLVLNPDVVLATAAVGNALRHLAAHPGTLMIAPSVRGPKGEEQYLCRRYPTVATLVLRGFAPAIIARRFRRRLDDYEMKDVIGVGKCAPVSIVSGCCMFARGDALRAVGGFSPDYFLYFEDYDLSLRLAEAGGGSGALEYVPDVRIVHHGGNAAGKGSHHVRLFARSAATFFNRHGWRWA
ncbi:MAG: glycosyltransferase family 2 protein [Gemmatimonadota bacterium]